jgi:hypothetical protein
MPGRSGVTVVTTLVCLFFHTRGCGCIERPAFPAPSDSWANSFCKTSGASRREIAESFREDGRVKFSAVIAREGGRSSIPEKPVMESRNRGVLDRPVKPDDDCSSWRSETMRFSAVRGASRRIYTAAPFG